MEINDDLPPIDILISSWMELINMLELIKTLRHKSDTFKLHLPIIKGGQQN